MNRDEYIKHEVEHIKWVSSLGGHKPCKVWVGKVATYPRSIIIRYRNSNHETVEVVGSKVAKEYIKLHNDNKWLKSLECKFYDWEVNELWDD